MEYAQADKGRPCDITGGEDNIKGQGEGHGMTSREDKKEVDNEINKTVFTKEPDWCGPWISGLPL